jgi:hypothetical protein
MIKIDVVPPRKRVNSGFSEIKVIDNVIEIRSDRRCISAERQEQEFRISTDKKNLSEKKKERKERREERQTKEKWLRDEGKNFLAKV